MQRIKACIISKNKELARFLALELENMYVDAVVCDTHDAAVWYDALIIDADIADSGIKQTCPVLRIISGTASAGNDSLIWPSSLENIREKLGSLLSVAVMDDASVEQIESNNVYAVSEKVFIISGERVELSKNEALILTELCHACGGVVSRARIMELLSATDGNISDVYICLLRKKLEKQLQKRLIFTHRNKGYSTCLRIEE
jgi:DNA-binding response OmpR family regulator